MRYQVWGGPDELKYIPACEACGELLRSSPIYDGQTGFCIRKRCVKERAANSTQREVPGE